MEVILLKDVKSLGKEGDTVKVKDGYARNYLVPKKIAMPYAPGAVKVLEAKRKKAARDAEKTKKTAAKLAETIAGLSLTISMESGVDDMLFGSVTSELISTTLKSEGVEIDKKNISIKEPIKKLGIYSAEVKLHPEIKQDLRIWVVKK
ncbi:50S ribosomal protein L9 [Candidatus Omnitrophota bacterium]